MDRRRFLRGAGSLLAASGLSGCVFFDAGGGRGYHFSLAPVTDDLAAAVALGPDDYSSDQRRVVLEAASEGESRVYGHRPIDEGAYVEYEDAYYRVQVAETGEEELTRTVLRSEAVNASEVDGSAVEMESYPRSDYEALKFAIATADKEGEVYVFRGRSAGESALLPEPEHEYVERDGEYVRLVVEERRVTETEFTYTVERAASSEAEFRELAAERKVTATFRPSELSDEQNEMLRTAIEDEDYTEFEPISDGYRELLERIDSDGELPEGRNSTYVEYDGAFYRATLSVSVP